MLCRKLHLVLSLILLSYFATSQCLSLNSWSLSSDNGNGTCTYDITVIVDSGNGAKGTAVFSIAGMTVYTENICVCNPANITFPITVTCESTVDISVSYDAPGNGNNCTGSTGDIVLPVSFSTFTGKQEDSVIKLEWVTHQEINNYGFEIEKRSDASNFVKIGSITGNGNSNKINTYEFVDRNPEISENLYRLKQVDFNGQYEYSKIIKVEFESTRDFVDISVIDFGSELILRTTKEIESLKIYNIHGQLLVSESNNFISGKYYIDINNLNPGNYFVITIDSNGKLDSNKFIKF